MHRSQGLLIRTLQLIPGYFTPLYQCFKSAMQSPYNSYNPRIWKMIFKNDIWTNIVENQNYKSVKSPLLVLLGANFNPEKGISLMLLVNDWGGDISHDKKQFYDSLHPFKFDARLDNVIHLIDFPITLHIQDATQSREILEVDDPSIYFNEKDNKLWTFLLYYGEPGPVKLRHKHIGGIKGLQGKASGRHAGAVRLKFRDGAPMYRAFANKAENTFLEPITCIKGGGHYIKAWQKRATPDTNSTGTPP